MIYAGLTLAHPNYIITIVLGIIYYIDAELAITVGRRTISEQTSPLCNAIAVFGQTIWQNMTASSAVAGHSLFPTTHIICTLRWLTVDTSTTTSPAQSSNAAPLTR